MASSNQPSPPKTTHTRTRVHRPLLLGNRLPWQPQLSEVSGVSGGASDRTVSTETASPLFSSRFRPVRSVMYLVRLNLITTKSFKGRFRWKNNLFVIFQATRCGTDMISHAGAILGFVFWASLWRHLERWPSWYLQNECGIITCLSPGYACLYWTNAVICGLMEPYSRPHCCITFMPSMLDGRLLRAWNFCRYPLCCDHVFGSDAHFLF